MDTPISINVKVFFPAARYLVAVLIVSVFASCAGLPPENAGLPYEKEVLLPERPDVLPEKPDISPESVPETVPEVKVVPERPLPSVNIMGKGLVPKVSLAEYLLLINIWADRDYILALSDFYIEEAAAEGINHDIAFAQMCLETGFLLFGGDVSPGQYNFAGLGATGKGEPGLSFPDPRTGVRAHIQHLKGYASNEPLNLEQVNPRYTLLRQIGRIGTSPTIHGLTGTWAMDPAYCKKIENILKHLFDFSF